MTIDVAQALHRRKALAVDHGELLLERALARLGGGQQRLFFLGQAFQFRLLALSGLDFLLGYGSGDQWPGGGNGGPGQAGAQEAATRRQLQARNVKQDSVAAAGALTAGAVVVC